MKIAITGATGNMGQAVMQALENEVYIEEIRLFSHTKKRTKKLLKKCKGLRGKVVIVEGSMADGNALKELALGTDVFLHLGAVIPPRSDRNPRGAVECNETGTNVLVSVLEEMEKQPKLLYISTVALYGNRTAPHRFGRVGDPLLVSPFDIYSITKLRGEFRVLESEIKEWVVFRQTAILHSEMLSGNISDGLMFHTRFDAPIEWVTAHDSGILVRNFLRRIRENDLPQTFWKRCYNIGGGEKERLFGYETYNDGFALIGGSTKHFFRPGYNATRNFHGVFYLDSDELENLFHFQQQSTEDYWKDILKLHPVYKLGKIVPRGVIRTFIIKRLLHDKNSPRYWARHGDTARIIAYFGSKEAYDKLQKTKWKDYPLPERYRAQSGVCDNETPVFYGYDISKADGEITLADLKSVAEAHGGRLLSEKFKKGDIYAKVEWETQDGEKFTATPYTVLRAGHWFNSAYESYVWEFDRLCKKDLIYASVWYDSHGKDEDMRYSFDENFKAQAVKTHEHSDYYLFGDGEHEESRRAI